jgi:hypothetical protein
MEQQQNYRPKLEELQQDSVIEENILAFAAARGSYNNLNLNEDTVKKQRPMTAKVTLGKGLQGF